jgi:hypothetical protein
MDNIQNYPLLTVFLIGLGIVLIATEIGRRLARHIGRRDEDDNFNTLEAAIIGVLALMIGFTFAMALDRFDSRRDAVMDEANAIGTTALRARMLPAPHDRQVLELLRDYVKVRLEITQRAATRDDLESTIAHSNELQEAMWIQTMSVAAKDNAMVPTGLFIQALNEMIDSQGKRLAAVRNHVPDVVILSLFAVAAIASAFSGYARGLGTQRSALPSYIIALLVCGVILLILDLDRPSAGFIEVSQQPMIDVEQSLDSYLK